MRKQRRPELSEHDIQTQIIQYLEMKQYYVQRMNSGKITTEYKGRKRMLHLSKVGTPDILAFKPIAPNLNGARLLFVEVKRPGNKPTDLQVMRMKELEEYGATCLVLHSVDEAMEAIC